MERKLVICKKCVDDFKLVPYTSPFQFRGFYTNFKVPEDMICGKCKTSLTETCVTMDEIKIIYSASHDSSFLEAMIALKEKDPIEYQLKFNQFELQYKQKEAMKMQTSSTVNSSRSVSVACPYCKSTNTTKISATSKAVSVAVWGIFSRKVHKQWHCNSCKSDF